MICLSIRWFSAVVALRRLRKWLSLTLCPVLLFAALAAALGACGRAPAAPTGSAANQLISLEALPDGLGRGFPVIALDTGTSQTVEVGREAPNVYLQLEDGRYVALRELRGRPILLNFWASWCGPCRLEMPELVNQAQRTPELVVLAVNVQEGLDRVQPFVEEFQMTIPVALDRNAELHDLYQVRGLPTTVFIDRRGKIALIWDGMLSATLLDEIVTDLQ
jgi:thiol-disulfide isomerase/thioredoxin